MMYSIASLESLQCEMKFKLGISLKYSVDSLKSLQCEMKMKTEYLTDV